MRSYKRVTICLVTAFIAMFVVFISSAQVYQKGDAEVAQAHKSITASWAMGDYESRFFGMIDIIMKNREKLALSDEQMTEIKDLKAQAKDTVTPMNKKMSALDVEINTLSWEEFDLDSINKLVAQKHQIMHQKTQYLTSMHNTLLCKILSPEQKGILKSMPEANQGVVDPGQDDLSCEEPEL